MEPFDGIRQVIDQNIYENQDGDITGEVMNQVLNDVVDAFEEAVTDGNNIRAFKGWWPDLATLKAAITAQPGDSAYVKDASPATTWSIYVYSASATSDNNWANSGSKADTSNVQTFASGEEVNETYIDNTHLVNPKDGSLPTAEDAMQLKVKLEGVTASEVRGSTTLDYNGYIVCKTVSQNIAKTYKYDSSVHTVFIPIPQGTKKLRFLGRFASSNNFTTGYAFINAENQQSIEDNIIVSSGGNAKDISDYIVELYPWKNNGTNNNTEINDVAIPDGATYFCAVYGTGSITQSNFYCYLQSGESVVNLMKPLEDNIDDINHAFSIEVTPSIVSTTSGHFYKGNVGSAITTGDSTNMKGTQFAVTPGKEYHLVDRLTSGYNALYLVIYTDANNIVLSRHCYTTSTTYSFDVILKAPDNAAYAYVNYLSTYSFKEIQINFVNVNNINETATENATAIGTINGQIETINGEIQEIQDSFKYEEGRVDAEYDSTISGSWWDGDVGSTISTTSSVAVTRGRRYFVTAGKTYHLNVTIRAAYYGFYMIRWCDENNIVLKLEERIYNTGQDHTFDKDYVAPENAAYFYINYLSFSTPTFQEITYGTADVGQMASDIEDLKESTSDYSKKLMKVVVSRMIGYGWTNAYYIRTKYNDTQDIIIQNQINSNTLLSFYAAYVGPNTLEDSQLRTSTYLVCDCDDSTAPFYGSTLYWHLYAQHGVPIPVINNNVNMTPSSVGTLWQDTITSGGEPFVRQYHIGYVDSSKIYLLPVFYEGSDGRMTRGWKNEADSTAITLLEFVDAGTGTDEGITQINVSGYDQVQKRPIIENSNRHFYADNIEITEPGTYYCDELKVSEFQVGYDPATITDANYFSGPSNRVNLEGALPLVEFTWSYLYKGATCAMNTTVKMLREFRCYSYGAIQQQYFHNLNYDNKTYTAKFLIPKCKLNSMNVPFTEPSGAKAYYRTSSNLVNVDDPVDRQIGWLENTSGTNDFRVGLAAGLSLVTGDTVKEKRIQNIPVGDRPAGATSASNFWRLGSISPSNTNKFYIAAINTAPYQDNNYNFPVGMFKEINCYVSYFDPSQNFGQVYWYKDGNSYLIYCHAQSASQNQVINVPEYMEGLNLSIVEKTDDTSLLSETITNGKFYVQYTGEGAAKYIVLKAH